MAEPLSAAQDEGAPSALDISFGLPVVIVNRAFQNQVISLRDFEKMIEQFFVRVLFVERVDMTAERKDVARLDQQSRLGYVTQSGGCGGTLHGQKNCALQRGLEWRVAI